MPTAIEKFCQTLNDQAPEFGLELRADHIKRLGDYYELLLKWNTRLHLVAPCSPEEFASRHILESIFLVNRLRQDSRVVDIGSGAGLPIIPCLIVRRDLRVTLIESSPKKAVFLREALRLAGPKAGQVTVARFEEIEAPDSDFVTCRALDRFQELLPALIQWTPAESELLLFAGPALRRRIEALIPSAEAYLLPRSNQRFLIRARKPHEITKRPF